MVPTPILLIYQPAHSSTLITSAESLFCSRFTSILQAGLNEAGRWVWQNILELHTLVMNRVIMGRLITHQSTPCVATHMHT